MSAQEVVDRMIAGWNAMDAEAILACFAEDAVYHNIPFPEASTGKAQIREGIATFMSTLGAVDWEVTHQTWTGDVVMNERVDRFEIQGQWIAVRVMGVFEIRDGCISAWRDYFDMAEFQAEMARIQG